MSDAPAADRPSAIRHALDRRWRQFATALCFFVFGAGGLLFGITVFPLACLTTRDPRVSRRRAQWIVQQWFRTFSNLMRVVGVISWEIHGAERLRTPGQMIIANHPTLIDVVLLIAYIPQVDCIVKESLLRNPFTCLPLRWAGYIGNSTPAQLVADCTATLAAGRSLLIFPEGTRSRPGQPLQAPHGSARIALESGAPVLPVTIRCEPLMLDKGRPWLDVPPKPGHFRIEVGMPQSVAHYRHEAPSLTIAARRLTHDWLRAFEAATRAG